MTKTCLECGKIFEGEDRVFLNALIIFHDCKPKEANK